MRVLIADDDSASMRLMEDMVSGMGYDVIACSDGNEAWSRIETEPVDIALLDWMMPGMDGIDVCRKVRSRDDHGFNYLYIIMITAKSSEEDIISCCDAGADDFIVKPVDSNMLASRLRVGCRLVNYEAVLAENNVRLQKYNDEILQLAEERSKQLVHAERMATMGLLAAGIAHEINNPTTVISGNVQTIDQFFGDIRPVLSDGMNAEGVDSHKIEFILDEMPSIIEGMTNSVSRITKIVKGLKAYCRQNEVDMRVVDLNENIETSLDLCRNALKYHVTVEKRQGENLNSVKADSQQMDQVLVNLFVNAADAIDSEKEGHIVVETFNDGSWVCVRITDNGSGINDDKIDEIWKPFYTTKSVDKGTGLGLYTVRGIIENHGGEIEVRNAEEGGAVFEFRLPGIV